MTPIALDQITQEFVDVVSQHGHVFEEQAKRVFYYLALIQLSVSGLWMMIAGNSFLQSVTQLIKTALFLSVFYAGITLAPTWLPPLINGFIEIGQQAGTTAIEPSSIFNQGLTIAATIMKSVGGWGVIEHPFVSLLGVVVCLGVSLAYALIAAELAIVMIKTYLMMSLSSLFFAFGASDWTREMAMNFIKALVSLGLQLLSLYLLIGIGQQLGLRWLAVIVKAAEQHDVMPMIAILSAVIVFFTLIKNIPPYIASLSGLRGFQRSSDLMTGLAMMAVNRLLPNLPQQPRPSTPIGGVNKPPFHKPKLDGIKNSASNLGRTSK